MKLDLYGASSVTDEALQAVAELKALTLLNLGGYPLSTDQGVQAVAELKALALYLHSCLLVTDVGVRAVAGLTNLTSVTNAVNTTTASSSPPRLSSPHARVVGERGGATAPPTCTVTMYCLGEGRVGTSGGVSHRRETS